jgi:hypothetical protein
VGEGAYGRAVVVAAGLAGTAVAVASVVDGPPSSLPDLALGWAPILYAERAGLVAFLTVALGGLGSGIIAGSGVRSVGGGAFPTIDLERRPQAASDEAALADIQELSAQLTLLETRIERLEHSRDSSEREE